MDKTILYIFKIVSLVLIGLAVVLQAVVLIRGEEGLINNNILDNYMRLSYAALIIAAFLAILFPIIFMVQNPKNALKIGGALVVLVILGFICYSIASNSFDIIKLEALETTAETSKAVGGALYFTYIIGGLAVLSIIYSGISSLFK